MEQKVVLVIGLPGSGKTTYIAQHSEALKDFVVCDDYHKSVMEKKSKSFEDSSYYDDVRTAIAAGKNVLLSDIAWCKQDRLGIIEQGIRAFAAHRGVPITIEYVYFENNPQACKNNAIRRGRSDRIERELELIDRLSGEYVVPKGVNPVAVFKAVSR